MLRKLFVASALVALTGTMAVLSAGEDAAKPEKSTADRSTAAKQHDPDHMFASCIATGNQEEVILAEIGRDKATNDEVKKFAEMLVTDHQTFLIKLKKFAPEATQAGYLDAGDKDRQATGAKNKARATIQQTGAAAAEGDQKNRVENADGTAHQGLNFLQVERELAQECLALTQEKLKDKTGAEFDQCFIGQQIAMHMGMKVKLTVFQRHASSELAGIFAEGQKTTEAHLAKAEEIMKDLAHSQTGSEKKRERKANKETKEKETKE